MRAFLLLLALTPPASAADPGPRAKVELSPKDGVWVGQRVALAVTLYTPDFFAGVPSFEVPPIPGAVVLPPAGSPTIGSETLGGDTFTTQRHEFAVYAQRPGPVRIPAFPVRFETNAGFGKPTVRREVTTAEVSFEARTPPGADHLGTVVAARGLTVVDEWTPEPKALKVGDAFTRTVTTTAPGVPGMVFPPVRFDPIGGLAAYPKEPTVTDRADRGSLTGRRADATTFVCGRAGTVTIPDRTLTWFDLEAKELRTVELPGRTFEVAPAPTPAPVEEPPAAAKTGVGWWRVLLAAGMTLALGWDLAVRVRPWRKRVRAAREESEAACFARLRQNCATADPHAVYVALLAWLDRCGPVTLDDFTARAADAALAAALRDLEGRVYADRGPAAPGPWTPGDLSARLAAARRRLRALGRAVTAGALPPLNPTSPPAPRRSP